MMRPIALALVIFFLAGPLSAVSTRAAVINVPAPGAPQETLSMGAIVGDIVRSTQLKQIVDLLAAGQRDDARVALGEYLRANTRDARALELAGMMFMQEGSYPLAEETLTKAILNAPRRASAIAKLGVVLLLQNKARGAGIALNKAVEIDPYEPLALRYLAYLEQTRRRPLSVIYYLEKLMATGWVRDDRITEAHLALAQAYALAGRDGAIRDLLGPLILERGVSDNGAAGTIALLEAELRLGEVGAARKIVNRLRERLGTQDYRVRVGDAAVKRLEQDYAAARRELALLQKAAPDRTADIHYQLALTYRDEKDWQAASRELELAAAAANENQVAPILKELAAALASNGQAARALEALRRYGQKYPDLPSIPYLRAEIEAHLGDMVAARKTLSDVVARHARYTAALYLLGLVEWKLGHVEPARQAVRQMLAANPKDIRGWLTLVGMYDTTDATGPASPIYAVIEDALKANPNHPDLLYEKATVLYSAGDVAAAEAIYRQILRQVPDHLGALNNLAASVIDNGRDPASARPFIERARQMAPDEPSILDTYGWFLLHIGERDKAVQILEKASGAKPKDGTIRYHLGVAFLETGRRDEGRARIREALDLGLVKQDAEKARKLLDGVTTGR